MPGPRALDPGPPAPGPGPLAPAPSARSGYSWHEHACVARSCRRTPPTPIRPSVCSLFARRVLDEPVSVGPNLLGFRRISGSVLTRRRTFRRPTWLSRFQHWSTFRHSAVTSRHDWSLQSLVVLQSKRRCTISHDDRRGVLEARRRPTRRVVSSSRANDSRTGTRLNYYPPTCRAC